jgi:hypothetical protein
LSKNLVALVAEHMARRPNEKATGRATAGGRWRTARHLGRVAIQILGIPIKHTPPPVDRRGAALFSGEARVGDQGRNVGGEKSHAPATETVRRQRATLAKAVDRSNVAAQKLRGFALVQHDAAG